MAALLWKTRCCRLRRPMVALLLLGCCVVALNMLSAFRRSPQTFVLGRLLTLQESKYQQLRWSPVEVGPYLPYVISAIVDIRHPVPGVHQVMLTTWHNFSGPRTFRCCFRSESGHVEDVEAVYVSHFPMGILTSTYFCCNATAAFGPKTVVFAPKSCQANVSDSLTLVFPEPRPGEMALCTKVAFGNLDPQRLYEWFEIHRLMGVSHFVAFPHKRLADGAKRVFEFYRRRGLLTVIPFLEPGHPARYVGDRHSFPDQHKADINIPNFDCLIRLGGFTFAATIDFDEILVVNASKAGSILLPTFLKGLQKAFPDPAGFKFNTKLFMLNWTEAMLPSPLFHMRHVQCTDPMADRIKYFFMPDRVAMSTTHDIHPIQQFKRYSLPADMATLHHYRFCREEWKYKCLTTFRRHDDRSLLVLEKPLYDRLRLLPAGDELEPSHA